MDDEFHQATNNRVHPIPTPVKSIHCSTRFEAYWVTPVLELERYIVNATVARISVTAPNPFAKPKNIFM
jgi:hypothetical protein